MHVKYSIPEISSSLSTRGNPNNDGLHFECVLVILYGGIEVCSIIKRLPIVLIISVLVL